MKIVYFTHSLLSCWNHGNAHFLRGVLRALSAERHDVVALEPHGAWSLANLLADHGPQGLSAFHTAYPDLQLHQYPPTADLAALTDGADLVIVHEWNDPALVAAIGRLRRHARFTALFHDTHHRAVSDPTAIRTFDLTGYDGVLAFGEALAAVYRSWGWGNRVWVWHEAADTTLFHPPAIPQPRENLVWIGNWGDGERSAELETFLLAPARDTPIALDIHGVRYPPDARATLQQYGARYHGWLANAAAPAVFATHLATVHVPRRFYVDALPGIPTIRVFEALACGIPLLSAPWRDEEALFEPGDWLQAATGADMLRHMRGLLHDPDLRADLAARGLHRIRTRHSCTHRAAELLHIVANLANTPVRATETA